MEVDIPNLGGRDDGRPREVAEAVLDHQVPDVVERSYLRTTFQDKRADLLQQYADHLSGKTAGAENVVQLRA